MKAALSFLMGLITAGALLLTLSACAGDGSAGTPASTAATANPAASESQVLAEEQGELETVIEAIDPTSRTLTLRTAQGQTTTMKLAPNVDMARIRQGDTLLIGIRQTVSARVLPPGSAVLGASRKAGVAPKEEPGAWSQQLVLVNEITAIDLAANTATVQGADRQPRTIEVKTPEMQQRLHSLKVGDLLELTFTEVFTSRIKRKQ